MKNTSKAEHQTTASLLTALLTSPKSQINAHRLKLTERQIDIIWNEYKDQREWQRHNENQRAQLTNFLLIIVGALIALYASDQTAGYRWIIPIGLVIFGSLGYIAVVKYWERFMQHVHLERAYRGIIDAYFAPDTESDDRDDKNTTGNLFLQARETAKRAHLNDTESRLKDINFRQHCIWEALFGIIIAVGLILMVSDVLKYMGLI